MFDKQSKIAQIAIARASLRSTSGAELVFIDGYLFIYCAAVAPSIIAHIFLAVTQKSILKRNSINWVCVYAWTFAVSCWAIDNRKARRDQPEVSGQSAHLYNVEARKGRTQDSGCVLKGSAGPFTFIVLKCPGNTKVMCGVCFVCGYMLMCANLWRSQNPLA